MILRLMTASAIALLITGAVIANSSQTVTAQGSPAGAFCYLNPGAFLGPIRALDTGFLWSLNCAYESATTQVVVSDIEAATLSGDTLAGIAQKLANAVKADAASRGFAVTQVLLPQVVQVTPQ